MVGPYGTESLILSSVTARIHRFHLDLWDVQEVVEDLCEKKKKIIIKNQKLPLGKAHMMNKMF
jgi:hypothetical protein